MTQHTDILIPHKTCWRIAPAGRFAFIDDGAAYFAAARQAMLQARHSILLIGWDFDANITLDRTPDGAEDEGPARLGDFIIWLADRTPGLQIRLLRWDTGAIKSMLRPSELATVIRWKMHPRITLRLDGAHPPAASHHQKIVAIDDALAFAGGIDMTMQRWDTPEHLDDDPRRTTPRGRPLPPWHDATSAFDGPAARAIGDLARARWLAATDEALPPCPAPHDCWPKDLAPTFTDVSLGIARTLPKMDGQDPVHEIEAAWLAMIASAKRMIYAESQYFASRKIAHAIALRLTEDDPPEIVIVTPHSADGWLEPIAMDTARAKLIEALARVDHKKRLRLYHPVTAAEAPIYVHAKVTVVDDDLLRVGSSNFNNRSMRLDTECDVILSHPRAADLRATLLAEHLGTTPEVVTSTLAETGSLIATVEALRGPGRSLVPYVLPELSSLAEWLAENEILDPNGPDEIFESLSKRGLYKGWQHLLRGRFRRAPR
ncbi:phospholipase D/transphosphatidylase (plasmid) [Ketogulonicigenium vulgare Y25]|nr:phospholipase D-like domain-containing protein [Ketogulonicigenium vulgare]ADO44242.1 phospholipase D/transphosphatidylase [Ketogulonicigenium vulgare Y25]ALJ82681.1 phospholipase [Ketogulonicigenium vulgare]